jgi:CRP-like cAMP-binding protein
MKSFFKPWFMGSILLSRDIAKFKNEIPKIEIEEGKDIYPELKKDKCYLLLSGEISFSSSISPAENFTICTLINSGVFGLSGSSSSRSYHITAIYPSTIGIFEIGEIKSYLSKNKHVIPFKRGLLRKKIYIPSAPLLGLDPVEAVYYIISFIANQECKDRIKTVKISTQDIAKILGIKREIVTLAMVRLEKRGWIDIIKGNIILKR